MSVRSYINVGEGGHTRKPKEFAMTNNYIDYFDFVKTNDKNSIFSNPGIKQLISLVSANAKIDKSAFSNEKDATVAKLYMRMYLSLAVVRWCRGETLGVARQKSLEQMNNFVKSKENSNDPIAKNLVQMKEKFHPEFAKINMQDKENSERNIDIDAHNAKQLEQDFAKEFKQSLEMLNQMSQQNTMKKTLGETATKELNQQKTESFTSAKQQTQLLMQQMMMQQIMRQRAA